jgi:BirA family biotin operon repressor/biotin-[acetyl-CoA-carboxylase] ligase
LKQEILLQLKSDAFVSGEALSTPLGITRAALWKHIKTMQEDGADIESITGKGYRLISPPTVPRAEYVGAYLHHDAPVYYSPTVTSTNDVAKDAGQNRTLRRAVFIAGEQTAGKGRKGRTWVSPKDDGLYISFLLRPDIDPARISGLTLMAAVALTDALASVAGLSAGIKWPNDILIGGKKAAGILTESLLNMDGVDFIVCGIGINVTQSGFDDDLQDRATSLAQSGVGSINRTRLAAAVINAFFDAANAFEKDGLAAFMPAFRKRSVISGRVTIISPGHCDSGEFLGYDDDGAIRIDCGGIIKRFVAGEVSLRGENGYV